MDLKDFIEGNESVKTQQTFLLHAELYCDDDLTSAYQISKVAIEYSIDMKHWERVPSKQLAIGRPYPNKHYSCVQGRYEKSKLQEGILIFVPYSNKISRLQLRIMWTLSSREVMPSKSTLHFVEIMSVDIPSTNEHGVFFIKSRLVPTIIWDKYECLLKDVFPNTIKCSDIRHDSLCQGREFMLTNKTVYEGAEWNDGKQYSERNREQEQIVLSSLVGKTDLPKGLLYILFLHSSCEAKNIPLDKLEYVQTYAHAWPNTPIFWRMSDNAKNTSY